MTIADMARQLNVSRNTLYRRLKENGVDVKQLRDGEGQLTQYGMSAIAGLFDGVTGETSLDTELHGTVNMSDTQIAANFDTQDAIDVSKLSLRVAQLETECSGLKRENDMLKDTLADVRQQRDKAQEEARRQIEAAQAENARLIAALEAAQQTQQFMQQRLLPEKVEEGRGGWFARLFGRK